MGQLIADIFITSKNRPDLLTATLKSLRENTDRSQFRLTLVQDGPMYPEFDSVSLCEWDDLIDHALVHKSNMGLGPSINQALAHIDALNRWYDEADILQDSYGSRTAPFICYLQDDVLVSKGWLLKMVRFFRIFEEQYKLGFASGIECVEHPVKKDLGNGMVLKDWIRAANMFGRREYWMSMWPIPAFDPETRHLRAKPNDGMGSGVDWWFIRNHSNSVCKTGRTNLVFPGMMVHAGYNKSTWLQNGREMPESDLDKKRVDVCLDPEKMNGYADQFGGSDF